MTVTTTQHEKMIELKQEEEKETHFHHDNVNLSGCKMIVTPASGFVIDAVIKRI